MPTAQLIRCTAIEWRWQLIPDIDVLETTSELHQQGYQLVAEDFPLASACIAGQLGRLRRIQLPGKPTQLFAPEQALIHALAYPVALAATLPGDLVASFAGGAGTLTLHGQLPLLIPPHLGRVGLLAESGGWQSIPYEALDEQAQQAQRELEQLLRAIQKNPGGEPFATFGLLCHIVGCYASLKSRWQEDLQATQPPLLDRWLGGVGHRTHTQKLFAQRHQLQQQLELLERTHHQIEHLQTLSSAEQQDWQAGVESLWPQVEERARIVAAAYYRAARPGQRHIRVTPLEYASSLLTDPVSTPANAPSSLQVLADPVSQAIIAALRDRQQYRLDPATGATFRTSLALPDATGEMELAFPAEAQDECLEALGEALVDTWLVIQHQALQATHDLCEPFTTSIDALLAERGRQPAPKLRSLQVSQLRVLARVQLRLWLPLRLLPSHDPIRMPLLHLTMIEAEPNAPATLVQLALGTWIRLIPREKVTIPRLIVNLHSKHRIAKRLGIWLALYLRQYPRGVDVQMQALLKQAGIPFNTDSKAKKETRDAVTRAFKLLARKIQAQPEEGEEPAELNSNNRLRAADEEILWRYLDSAHDTAAVLGQYWVKRADEHTQDTIRGLLPNWFEIWLGLTWHLVPPTSSDS